jgi:hypothetical protein
MHSETEIKLARYSTVEKEADDFGRVIGVRRLKPSEQTKFAGMTADITGHDETMGHEGLMVQVSHRLPLLITASVCLIDEARIPFPRNSGELYAMYDRLDAEGLAAASRAMVRLNQTLAATDPVDEAKNLSGTPSSA